MRITILVVGRLKDKYLEAGLDDYLKRLRRYGSCEVVRLREESKSKRSVEATAIEKEALRMLGHIKPGDHLIAMSEEGELLDSPTFADFLSQRIDRTTGRIIFAIGSGAGLAPSLKEQAQDTISLSPMTFPHQMALLFLLEQIYRAQTILNNEPYHR